MAITVQELDLICKMIGDSGRAGYALGRDDERAGNPVKDQEFRLSLQQQLLIKKEINKYTKRR